ncbi:MULTISPECIES: hypothetical protein [unclassified Microcella]|uniref:hypothetical protein n=1 Tax=unclassified Microcella TaxID=2630066 RepID=UPI0006F853DC|nr:MULTISPECIES: hypothetical protein [unclassified Microcella]KQV25751.1 hypothetical protein ASC54_01835 [Yonghaparkia sp. Root332]KRF33440.1 hypothetical protein ASG83_05795 [Yonghaparkia sp. Soil809]
MKHTHAVTHSLITAALSTSLILVASPGIAADALRITTPVSGTIVSGELYIAGTIAGDGEHELTLQLAPQQLGECGSAVASTTTTVSARDGFSALVDTLTVADGTYCLVAVADRGRLSDVQADIRIDNEILRGFIQLPTESLPEPTDGASAIEAAVPAESGPVIAVAAFALAGILALGVAVYGIASGRRLMRP